MTILKFQLSFQNNLKSYLFLSFSVILGSDKCAKNFFKFFETKDFIWVTVTFSRLANTFDLFYQHYS